MDQQKKQSSSQDKQSDSEENQQTASRRRGKVLENAILQAAWDELNEEGYSKLTMEGIAARAKTNKSVLYRRWANKAELVIVALHKFIPEASTNLPDKAPDTGELRNDIIILLEKIVGPFQLIEAETIHGLMVDLSSKLMSLIPEIMHPEAENIFKKLVRDILENAELRGEIDLEKISSRVIALPIDLLYIEFLSTHKPVAEQTIVEIVDDVFLPLVYR